MSYCCASMERFSAGKLIRRTRIEDIPGGVVGIHTNDGGESIIAIAKCPWCGNPLTTPEQLVGKRMVETA